MARKRGGLAGLYDKTKPFLRVAAPIALGAIPGVGVPLAVAAGAAMGADKEGRKLLDWRNVGGAITGGLAGYTGGKMGESIRQTVQNRVKDLLTARAGSRAGSKGLEAGTKALEGFQVPDLTDYNALSDIGVRQRGIFEGLTGEGGMPLTSRLTTAAAPNITAAAPRVVAPTARAAAGPVGPLASSPVPAPQGMLNRSPSLETINRSMGATPTPNPSDALKNKEGPFGRFAEQFRKNKDIIEMVGKYAMPPRESEANITSAEASRMRAETERMMFEDEKAQREARQRALQQYFMPMLGQIQQERQGMSFGPMYRG